MYNSVHGLLFTIGVAIFVAHCIAFNSATQQPLSSSLLVRNATVADAEAITSIISAAFYDSPHMKYVYQFMDEYPKDHHDCMYELIHAALGLGTSSVLAEVALLPNDTHPHELTPVAVALWVLPTAWKSADNRAVPLLSMLEQSKCSDRYLNTTRFSDFMDQFNSAKENYLDGVYTHQNQLYLDSLATRPDYQRRGAGSALVRSGLEFGKDMYANENITATLIATEAGEPLYRYMEWTTLRNFTVRSLDVVEGSREEWRFDVMKYDL